MNKIDGKTKNTGGLKDISECRQWKSDEPIVEVSVRVVINGKESQISLNDFKVLLLKDIKVEDIKKSKKVVGAQKILNSFYDKIDTPENKKYRELYGQRMIIEFADYWTEMSANGKKVRYQKEKTFDIGRRLKTWAKRDFNGNYKEHKIQLEKIRQDEYLKKAKEEAYMTPEEQRSEFRKLTQGMFKGMNEEV